MLYAYLWGKVKSILQLKINYFELLWLISLFGYIAVSDF